MTATITLKDDDQSTVRRMLTYLYTLDYDDGDAFPAEAVAASEKTEGLVEDLGSEPDVEDDEKVSHCKRMNNIRVYTLAEKYNIPALKDLAKDKFENHKTAGNLTYYQEVINTVYDSTPETDSGLRDIVISRIAQVSTLGTISKEGPLVSALRDHSSFGLGLLWEVIKKPSSEKEQLKERLCLKLEGLYRNAMDIYVPANRHHERTSTTKLQEDLLELWNSVRQEK